ncbi:hypothetical protein AVEN_172038-1 [Araneus ventricosus]|uniref:Uncharacterized protein n=1 Tax=Araneus ventricosus TaxID=182803 RepID=A0A4Y2S8R0_ARAVE|nr:hypothetical protein AVEN_153503-1 [Araneus ventricosus]GBN84233.1 hypothetical protein AVEN_172038-1 [Araneus ventricosus]
MKLRLQDAQLIAVIHHRDFYSQALTKGLLRMSKRYRGRYLTARLCKRQLNSSDPPKRCYYSIPQLTKGANLAKDLAKITGLINARFIEVQIPQTNTTE